MLGRSSGLSQFALGGLGEHILECGTSRDHGEYVVMFDALCMNEHRAICDLKGLLELASDISWAFDVE